MEQKPFPNSDDNTDRETGSITQAAASAQTLREMGLARSRGTQAAPTTLPRSPSPWWAAGRKKMALLSFLLRLLQRWGSLSWGDFGKERAASALGLPRRMLPEPGEGNCNPDTCKTLPRATGA